jgi:DNA-binding MarR family transcriptional regulator|tara:strand:- start:344 stop:778 length:435 start_codon:yes stop_codon:yes gene_type:complete
MSKNYDFDLKDFLPYLLNQAAEETSRKFEPHYKARYGMLRTEWRVIFHLGRYGKLTAKAICDRARMHKTKVSRAVQSLESKGFLQRQRSVDDRRHELLALTPTGDSVFIDLFEEAQKFDADLMSKFTEEDQKALRQMLTAIVGL